MSKMIERFLRLTDKKAVDECWPWLGSLQANRSGDLYGYFRDGRMRRANRVAHEIWIGPIPAGQVVRHTCDNSVCVNPKHLVAGTQKQNVADRYERGRDFHHRGEDHKNSKLSAEQVIEIRAAIAGGRSQRSVAAEYGVSQFGVRYAVKGWQHVGIS